MTPSNPTDLYAFPITELGLTEESLRLVQRSGIISVGDCIDFFTRGAVTGVDSNVLKVMFGVVLPLLEKHGYWPQVRQEKIVYLSVYWQRMPFN